MNQICLTCIFFILTFILVKGDILSLINYFRSKLTFRMATNVVTTITQEKLSKFKKLTKNICDKIELDSAVEVLNLWFTVVIV